MRNRQKTFLWLFCSLVLLSSCKEDVVPSVIDGQLNWLTIEDLDKLDNKAGKKIIVDVYTDWCGWCKVMDKKTFTDPAVIDYIDKNYYVVKFNAERREPVTFNGKVYEITKRGRKGTNKLAVDLLGGRLSYPSLVILDKNKEKLSVMIGYKTPDKLLSGLNEI